MGNATKTPVTGNVPANDWPLFTQSRDIAASLVQRKLGALLRNNGEEGVDDVVARAVAKVWGAYPRFDANRSTFSTFVGVITRQTIADVKRRYARRQRLMAERPDTRPDPEFSMDAEREPADLVEWFRETYEGIQQVIRLPKRTGPRPKGRPRVYSTHQTLAVRALERKLGLSVRGVEMVLKQRPELLAAIGLTRVPGKSSVCRGRESVPKMKKYLVPPS